MAIARNDPTKLSRTARLILPALDSEPELIRFKSQQDKRAARRAKGQKRCHQSWRDPYLSYRVVRNSERQPRSDGMTH